jgi:hypothetical protein
MIIGIGVFLTIMISSESQQIEILKYQALIRRVRCG